MRLSTTWLPLLLCVAFLYTVEAQSRRIRVRQRPIQQQEDIDSQEQVEIEEEDNTPQPALQYYTADSRNNVPGQGRLVLVSDDDDYNGLYGQPTSPAPRPRVDYNRPAAKSSTTAPRTKETGTKAPPVQTIRNYSKVNDDGSFTFGYEAADGSFKEETRGTDCVVRGKYGYVDPDGNKREFTYVSGNPCDPNHPDETEEEPERSAEEQSNEPENVPQNFPRRPVTPRPVPSRPVPTTTQHAPTTVFQNTYASSSYQDENEDEQPEPIQLLQQQPQRPRVTARPHVRQPEEVTIRQRPRITVQQPTPAPSVYNSPTHPTNSVSITPRPTYRIPQQSLQTQPPATTYRPAAQFVTQRPASVTYSQPTQSHLSVEPINKNAYSSVRKPIDFAVEFQKFQQEHNAVQSTTSRSAPTQKPFKPSQKIQQQNPTSNPVYESQLVFDPSTGQYDSALYQQLPQSDGDFSSNHRIQPYQPQFNQAQTQFQQPQPQLISLEQLQQQQAGQPIFHRQAAPTARSPVPQLPQFPQFSQQVYQKEQEGHQVLNSQQLYAQQQELQQQQLHQDRIEAAKRQQAPHRFQAQQAQNLRQESPQGFYYVQQPQQSTGQIDAFLRGHNIDFN